jgi:AraC-like DNA-binding protein
MTDNNVSFTWGLSELDDIGYVQVFNFMLRSYAALGVSRAEMLLIIHLASYKYNTENGKSCPSMNTIAAEMGYEDRATVLRLVKSLEEKKMLWITRTPGFPHEYNAKPFASKTLKLWLETRGCDEKVTGGVTKKSQGGVTKKSHEEKEIEKINTTSAKNADIDAEQLPEPEYVPAGNEFDDNGSANKPPKWAEPKTDMEKHIMSAIPRKTRWKKEERDAITQLRMIEKSMTPLIENSQQRYPIEWVDHVIEWWRVKQETGYVPLGGLVTALNNADWKHRWMSKRETQIDTGVIMIEDGPAGSWV